jgi:hypothetical protein
MDGWMDVKLVLMIAYRSTILYIRSNVRVCKLISCCKEKIGVALSWLQSRAKRLRLKIPVGYGIKKYPIMQRPIFQRTPHKRSFDGIPILISFADWCLIHKANFHFKFWEFSLMKCMHFCEAM